MATAAVKREMDYVSKVRDANRKFWDAFLTLKGLQKESVAQNYNSNLGPECFAVNTEHEGLTSADIIAVVHTTIDAVETFLASGHNTNITKIL